MPEHSHTVSIEKARSEGLTVWRAVCSGCDETGRWSVFISEAANDLWFKPTADVALSA